MKLMNGVDEGLGKKGCQRGEKTFDAESISVLGVSEKKMPSYSCLTQHLIALKWWKGVAPMNTSRDQMHMPDIRDLRLVYHLDNSFDICVLSWNYAL